MVKELRYLLYIIIVFLVFFFTSKYYFSDSNKKNSYRSHETIDKKITIFSKNLILLKSDTENIIEYINESDDKNKKVFNFWNLINNDN